MQLSASKEDISVFIDSIGYSSTLFNQCVTFSDYVEIKKTGIYLSLKVSADKGYIVLNIASATIFGLSVFGLVRKIAGNLILSVLKPYSDFVKYFKDPQGNIRLYMSDVYFNSADCVDGEIKLGFNLL